MSAQMRTNAYVVDRVESLRVSAGLSKTRLAIQLGLSAKEYQRMLQGTRPLRAIELWHAATVFQRTMESFFEEENVAVSGSDAARMGG